MKMYAHHLAACCLAGTLLSLQAVGQTSNVVVQTDLECRIVVDGKPRGTLNPGAPLRLTLDPGEHSVEAQPLAGGVAWQSTLDVKADAAQTLNIPMRWTVTRNEIERRGYWIDSSTGLWWAAADNGSGVSHSQAANYCKWLSLGGHRDWVLPAIDALQGIFGGAADDGGFRLISPLKLTGWAWSSTTGNEPGEAWALDFGDGARASVIAGDSGLNRALCVRQSPTNGTKLDPVPLPSPPTAKTPAKQ